MESSCMKDKDGWNWPSEIVVARALHWLAQALAEPEQDATQQDGSFVCTVDEVIPGIYMT